MTPGDSYKSAPGRKIGMAVPLRFRDHPPALRRAWFPETTSTRWASEPATRDYAVEGRQVGLPDGGGRACRLVAAAAMSVGLTVALAPRAAGAQTSQTGNPSASIYPNPPFFQSCSGATYDDSSSCVNATVRAIDNARQQEGVSDLALPTNWYSLTPAEQLYVATNLERTARGLPPLSGMATKLDQASAQAAQQGEDPEPPSDFPSTLWGGNWAGGSGNPLENVYYWMYYDGANSNNMDCQHAGDSGCWVHRHNILLALQCQPCVMGTGFAPSGWQGDTSWAELLADTSGTPQL
ncbi:MAG: hypothetical protein ACYDB3_06495, partial [Acidimicrobiales bacterium]